ncbi:MAG: alpha/beta fold hydrolase [Sneathiellaceae bacterium]
MTSTKSPPPTDRVADRVTGRVAGRVPGRVAARAALRQGLRLLLGAVLVLAMFGPAHAAGMGPEARPCPFAIPFGEVAQCGILPVPQDHRAEAGGPGAGGAPFELFFAILRAHAAAPAADPIVHLAGGPGQAMSDFADAMWFRTVADRAARDVILFDMRGTGLSRPLLDCAGLDDDIVDGNPANDGASADPEQVRAALAACRAGYAAQGIDLSLFDSEQAARDLKRLREALGIERWNLVGTSYGTRLALEAARQDPEGIRSLVLNSTMTMGDAFEPGTFDDRVRILRRLFADCAADPGCDAAFPDLKGQFAALRARLSEAPLTVHVVPPEGGATIPVHLDVEAFVGLLMTHLSFQPGVELVPLIIDRVNQVAAGRRTLTDADWREIMGPGLLQGEGLAVGLYLSVLCREVDPVHDAAAAHARIEDSQGLFSPRDLELLATHCPAWPSGAARPDFAEPVRSDIPALLLFGEYDPLTPPYWTAAAVATLPNGRAIAFPGAAHDVLGSSLCAQTVVTAFIRDPGAALDTACVESQRPRFFIPPPAEPRD